MGYHFLLQGIFQTQGLNPCLPYCRQTLYHLSQDFGTNFRICLLVPAVLSVSLRNCPAISIQLDHSEFWLLSCPFCRIAGLCLSSSSLCCDLEKLPPRRKPGWWWGSCYHVVPSPLMPSCFLNLRDHNFSLFVFWYLNIVCLVYVGMSLLILSWPKLEAHSWFLS